MIEIIGQAMWKDNFERWKMEGRAWWVYAKDTTEKYVCKLQWIPFGCENSNGTFV
jgi:hypothetical protein